MSVDNDIVNLTTKDLKCLILYDINLIEGTTKKIEIPAESGLFNYSIKAVNRILNDFENYREFKFESNTVETYTLIVNSLREDDNIVYEENAKRFAERLLVAEEKVQRGAVSARDGGLIQAVFNKNEKYYYLFIKNEFEKVIPRNEVEVIDAFITGSSALIKSGLIEFIKAEDKFEESRNFVEDTITKTYAIYWYSTFLNLVPINDDYTNTENLINKTIQFFRKANKNYIVSEDIGKEALGEIRVDIEKRALAYIMSQKYLKVEDMLDSLNEAFKFNNYKEIQKSFDAMSEHPRTGFDKTMTINLDVLKERRNKYRFEPQDGIELNVFRGFNPHDIYIQNDVIHIKNKDENASKFLPEAIQN